MELVIRYISLIFSEQHYYMMIEFDKSNGVDSKSQVKVEKVLGFNNHVSFSRYLKLEGHVSPLNSSSMKAVSFTTRHMGITGILKLPALIINKSTKCKLWNMIAFEMSVDDCENEYGVTSYLHFLSSQIETEQDVRELRTTKVFRTHLKSDAEVVDLFKTIHNNL
ncbi:LOW QUALITY PROTEIN: hypothetical protein PanWU01x14_212640 [Parasponia andersonii]|uniref:Uncharacterized protein n=1 Tax=Parasponia andersonii TaxID=3476 RepID=A0A2P5BST8_PARAD|nr:LOW QUALITY PROTEIN: hypothetical protein PanWU01x14_212640 [Parasponia andersonii]